MKYVLIIALLFTTVMSAQRGDRIKAFKRAHITEALDLSSAEAEKFWPVYNAHEDKMEALRKKERMEVFQIAKGDMDDITDAEADLIIEKSMGFKEEELKLSKEFIVALRKVIPPKKMLKLHRAEEEFKRVLLDQMRKRQKGFNRN